MKSLALVLVLAAAPAFSEEPEKEFRYNGNGYGYFTAGGCQHGYALYGGGGGAEGLVWRGLIVGAEGGYQQFSDHWGFGTFLLDTGYHFVNRKRPQKVDPFVIGGLGIAAGNGGFAGAMTLGGGVIYWVKPRIGIRTEGRLNGAGGEGMFVFRVGVSFR